MNIDDFKRVLSAFVDDASDLEYSHGTMVAQIQGELIDVNVVDVEGDLRVTEAGETVRAYTWLINRIAKVPLLADRLLRMVEEVSPFIVPSGRLLDHLEEHPDGDESTIDEVPDAVLELLGRRTPGTSTVLYLTSDAGEGKTTIINELARMQAARFKAKKSPWLLVPISLGGRSFLTFDDVVVAELVNRFRFKLFYYEAFLELVRLGVLVPAFDGFEEMFVEGTSGEALSALGNLMHDLSSEGALLIAARKAYFEYQNFDTQARLFDAIGGNSVAFARLDLDRWDRARFVDYATKRGLASASDLYDAVAGRFGTEEHPLLTRAVLVSRLVEVVLEEGLGAVVGKLGTRPEDYFFHFVDTIVAREATKKWIDRSGSPHVPLLTVPQHHELLAFVAREMWLTSSDVLRGDYLDLISELFAGEQRLPPGVAAQVSRRLRDHSLLRLEATGGQAYGFDHEDFRRFFLGEALGGIIAQSSTQELGLLLQKAVLPGDAADAAVGKFLRMGGKVAKAVDVLQSVGHHASVASYASENVGALTMRLLDRAALGGSYVVKETTFPVNALRGRALNEIIFERCHFRQSSLEGTTLSSCTFRRCNFEEVTLDRGFSACDTTFVNTTVSRLNDECNANDGEFDPVTIMSRMMAAGIVYTDHLVPRDPRAGDQQHPEPDAVLAEHALRIFMRATQVNDDVFQMRLGVRASRFFEVVLPVMLEMGILEEVPYKGSGKKKRFKLRVPMRHIGAAIPVRVAGLEEFLERVRDGVDPQPRRI